MATVGRTHGKTQDKTPGTLSSGLSKLGRISENRAKAELISNVSDTFSIFLCDLLNYLETEGKGSHKFDSKLFEGLSVTLVEGLDARLETSDTNVQSACESLHDNAFFSPMSLDDFSGFTPDLSHEWARQLVDEYLGDWYVSTMKKPFTDDVTYQNGLALCLALKVAFSELPYNSPENETSFELRGLTSWIESDGEEAFQHRDWDGYALWRDESKSLPEHVWAAKDKPHMMVSMTHDYKHDDDVLFVSEIKAIVALMIVRLVNGSFPDTNVVPVMVFSFTGDKRGRILQAYMNENSLVIRKSQFYDWSSRQDAHLNLFLQYMMSNLQGPTQILDHPRIESRIAKQPYTIEHLKNSRAIE